MLRYLILVTENLIVTAITVGMLYGYVGRLGNKTGKIFLWAGTLLGFLASVAFAIAKNNTNKIHTGMWNLWIFSIMTAAVIAFMIFTIRGVQKKAPAGTGICAAVITFTSIFYTFPDVLNYPFTFNLNGASVLSTAFFSRFVGWLAGWLVALLVFLGLKYLCARISQDLVCGILDILLAMIAGSRMVRGLDTLRVSRVITDKKIAHEIFVAAKFVNNQSDLFIYAAMLLTVCIPSIMFLRSFRISEPYKNSAERRKLLAANIKNRNWSIVVMLCYVITVLCLTWFTALSTQVVELSQIGRAHV